MIKYTYYILFLTVIQTSVQKFANAQDYFSVGGPRWGIAFGNASKYNGVRFNLVDKYEPEILNGVSFAVFSKIIKINGLSVSIINKNNYSSTTYNNEKPIKPTSNGIKLAPVIIGGTHNGFQLSLYHSGKNYNGSGITLSFLNSHEYGNRCGCYSIHKGVLIGVINKHIMTKGLQIGIINLYSFSDVTLGLINIDFSNNNQIGMINYLRDGDGFQIGLINIRKKNKWFAKVLPIVNFKWEKRKE